MRRCKKQVVVNGAYYHYFQSPSSLLRSEFGLHRLEIYKVFNYWLDVSNENDGIFDIHLRVIIVWQIITFWRFPGAVCEEHINAIFKLLKKSYRFETDEENEITEMVEILRKMSEDIALKNLQRLPNFIADMVNIIAGKIKEKEYLSDFENVNNVLQEIKSKYPDLFKSQKFRIKSIIKRLLRRLKFFCDRCSELF